jgi:WD40 repeat protein
VVAAPDGHNVEFASESGEMWAATSKGILRWRVEFEAAQPGRKPARATVSPPTVALPPLAEGPVFVYLAGSARRAVLSAYRSGRIAWLDLTEREPQPHWLENLPAGDVDVSADGRLFTVATGRSVIVYRLEPTVEPLARVDSADMCHRATFSPDGRHMAVSTASQCLIVDTRTWHVRHAISRLDPSHRRGDAAFSANGRTLAIMASAYDVQLVDVDSGKQRLTLSVQTAYPNTDPCFSADGKLMLPGDQFKIRCWDLGRLQQSLAELGIGDRF